MNAPEDVCATRLSYFCYVWSFDADAREAVAFPDIGRYPPGLEIGLRYRACLLPFGIIAEAESAEEARDTCYLEMLNALVDAEENGELEDFLAASGLSRTQDGVWQPPPLGGGQAFQLLLVSQRNPDGRRVVVLDDEQPLD
ncbi:MAG: hypothetical protein ACUVSX_15055 [Aggregatilineales bacterium]